MLGRGGAEGGDELPRIAFQRQRPGANVARPPLTNARISRMQLELRPLDDGRLHVSCIGQPGLVINGVEQSEGTVAVGDTIRVRNSLVLLVERRRAVMPKRPALESQPMFEFGVADVCGIVGESDAAWDLRERLAFVAETDRHTLLLGESGVGKELAARAIHAMSKRKREALVSRNASTLPSGIVDAELFGNAKNYPNPGTAERSGLVGEADGGTLFLDEIGELPADLQSRLLRVMDRDGEYQRLGDATVRRANVRIIAATNRSLDAIKHDVLARFPMRVTLPDLNARRADVPLLVRSLLDGFATRSPTLAARFFDTSGPRLDPALVEALLRHTYTHHARELDFLLSVALSSSPGDYIALTEETASELALPPAVGGSDDEGSGPLDRAAVESALQACSGSTTRAAQRLGLPSRFALYRLMKRLGISSEPVQH
ncbi:MAG: sigma-54-dependent Fis family transcriptional regulator [Deltaproteobacteria bacterium]|nr:sigma-54-dependent Fis family transcriptional regulator [Deltaproteobacteria bacterium]